MQSPPGLNCWLTDRQGDYVAERKPSFVSPPKYGAIQKRVCRGQSTVMRGSGFVPSQTSYVDADPKWKFRGGPAGALCTHFPAKDPSHRHPINHHNTCSLTRKWNHFLILAEVLERCWKRKEKENPDTNSLT